MVQPKKKKDKKPKVRQDIHLEMENQMFDKQTFAGPCKDNGTQLPTVIPIPSFPLLCLAHIRYRYLW